MATFNKVCMITFFKLADFSYVLDRYRFVACPDPILHFDADPDPDPDPTLNRKIRRKFVFLLIQ
jgi:hypothetical protein